MLEHEILNTIFRIIIQAIEVVRHIKQLCSHGHVVFKTVGL